MKETKVITQWERVQTGKSVKEYITESREWLLGESGLNGWQWYVDFEGNLVLERMTYPNHV